MMRIAKRETASINKHSHAFLHGIGYVFVGPQQPRSSITMPCKPPPETKPGTLHHLDTPQGKRIILRWDGKFWEHPHNPAAGNRLGWTSEYLGSHGWKHKLAVAH